MKKILIIIPARGGSKGIPRKNLRILNNYPLIYYSIRNTQMLKGYDFYSYVSTEDQEISLIAKKFGAKIIKRDSEKSDDNITLDPVIYDAFVKICESQEQGFSAVITLQPTSPLLSFKTLNNAIDYFFSKQLDTLISGVEDTHLTWKKVNNKFIPNYKKRLNRQLLPKTYKESGGFVITKPEFISEASRIGQKVEIFLLSKKEGIDIDDFHDWNLCEFYLRRKTILFVVAGNNEIGMGHVYNTLSIANNILDHRVIFLTTTGSELAFSKIKESNYEVIKQKSQLILDDIIELSPDIIINDILDTDIEYIQSLKNQNFKVINFEDIGEGAACADLVINAMYPDTNFVKNQYYGEKYFILRDEFYFTKTKKINSKVKKILLSFGGVDPNNYTERILKILERDFKQKFNITVVAGLGYKFSERIKENYPNVNLKINIKNISEEMYNADVVFTSAGRTTFEVASIGVPCIVLCQNEREKTHLFASEENGFLNLGAGYKIPDKLISKSLLSILENFDFRNEMQEKMLRSNIKKGKVRVINLIKQEINR